MVSPRVLAMLLLLACGAVAQDESCTCAQGNASWLFLKSPKPPPADPDPCPLTKNGTHPGRRMPAHWDPECRQSARMACFLRRHAASWRIDCSLCATERCCPHANWRHCPDCGGAERPPPFGHERVLKFVETQRAIGGKAIEGAMSPHFVVVTDIPMLRIDTAGGGRRPADKHEILHLFLQRAEMARSDFEVVFGGAYEERSAIGLVRSHKVRMKFSQAWFGHAPTPLRRGYNAAKTIAGGLACNGWCGWGRDDDKLHFAMRHMIGHLLMSTYLRASPMEKYLPRWVDAGSAHWLCRLHPRAEDFAAYCLQEGTSKVLPGKARAGTGALNLETVYGTGHRWLDKARKIARRGPRRDPVEAMFSASTVKQMTTDVHIRAWSWFDVFAREEREPFVQFIRLLRRGKEPREAAKAVWNQAPENVDQRWRDYLLARHRLEGPTATEEEREAPDTTLAERNAIRAETDIRILASRIRGLQRCEDKATAALLLSLVDRRKSDRVQAVVAMVLEHTSNETVLAWLRDVGFREAGKTGRAILCRVFGRQADARATPVLRTALEDGFWLVRANAARALGQVRDGESLPALIEMAAADRSGKLRIAGMDALPAFGADARSAVARVAKNLEHPAWQVKVAACETLARLGDDAAVDALVDRLSLEGGRVHHEIRLALKALTGIDRPWKPETWRKWWDKQKTHKELEQKSRDALGKKGETPKPKGRYADPEERKPPTYYGIPVFARSVGYVLDISASMKQGFQVSPEWQKRLGRTYDAKTRIGVCKQEIAQSIRSLDPRTRLNIFFFNHRAKAWQAAPVAAGAMGENGIRAAFNALPDGETNYYDALRLVLGEQSGRRAQFAETPDTLLFLTDGLPTTGEITKGDELLAWFNERNRFARLRVHVIAMGRAGVDAEFLRAFAAENRGRFVMFRGTH